MTRLEIPDNRTTSPGITNLWFVAAMILGAALFRIIPSPEYRPPNLAPIGAMALFGGAAIANRRLAFVVPLLAMLISDLFIEFDSSRLWVYGSIVLITLLGRTLQNHRRQASYVVVGSLGASLLFFLVTNFGVWLNSGWYTHTFGQFVRCYVEAIPFFRNTVAGDLAFSGILFGGLAYLESREASTVRSASIDL